MGNMLFYAHSGLRFLVLLAAVIAIAVLLWGWSARRPFAGQSRAVTAVFTGVLDLQVLLGILTVLTRPWYGQLMGHLMMMILAAVAAHGITVYGRKQPDPRRAHMVTLAGVVLALLLIVGGIMAIRPSPFHMTPGAGATATSTG
jgi:heme A synthase